MAPEADLESTATLLTRVRAGDEDARERLVARYLALLRRWAHGRVPPRARGLADTDDLVQATLLRALNALPHFEPRREGAFLAYLRKILVNQLRTVAKRAEGGPPLHSLPSQLEGPDTSPLEQAIGAEALETYEAALGSLTEDQQQAVVLRIELGLSFQQVAEAMESPSADAARMLVARGLAHLSERMLEHAG
jgi:RNA polymerase sigma-70 factor (ECF subfamily)